MLTPIRQIIGLSLALLLTGCGVDSHHSQLEQIRQRKELRVGLVYGPTSYYQRDDTAMGFDYELIQAFADSLGVRLTITPFNAASELIEPIRKGKLDLGAGAIVVTPARRELLRFSPSYYQVAHKLVYRNGRSKPSDLNALKGPIVVPENSMLTDLLQNLSQRHAGLAWQSKNQADMESLLKAVASGQLHYTVVQDTVLARAQRYYPELAGALTLGENQQIAWALRRLPDDSLYASVIDFFGQRFMDGTIAKLDEKYFGHVQEFDYVDTRTFLSRAKSVLPKYQGMFQTHAREIDWRLLAAISYQESHWDPLARSYTGVRGMMMLTNPTAKAMGVEDRLHPEESIRGGARYLEKMMDRVPDAVPADEKVWFALAAYNMGYGHMMDARHLAKRLGKNPNAWSDVKDVLPLLQEAKWHKQLRFGYARGSEARDYVNNVRQYYQSLLWFDNQPMHKPTLEEAVAETQPSTSQVPRQRKARASGPAALPQIDTRLPAAANDAPASLPSAS
ncbi:MAG: membrane-bound lytic murein transglycosylase MltF [Aeromonas sp.]